MTRPARYALAALSAPVLLCAALDVPAPRLIGYGCTDAPAIGPLTYTGPRLAAEESDFPRCDDIRPIF